MNNTPVSGLPLIGAGNILVSMIIAGFLLGYLVDGWLNTPPWFMLGLGALGLIGGFHRAHQLLRMTDGPRQQG